MSAEVFSLSCLPAVLRLSSGGSLLVLQSIKVLTANHTWTYSIFSVTYPGSLEVLPNLCTQDGSNAYRCAAMVEVAVVRKTGSQLKHSLELFVYHGHAPSDYLIWHQVTVFHC
jgi:hypothetical protein